MSGPPDAPDTAAPSADALREQRALLIGDASLTGAAFGAALARALDRVLADVLASSDVDGPAAVVALGSYGRRELCPSSDVDVLLLHALPRRRAQSVKQLAERLWYPLWDAGFVTGHGARTVKESIALADQEIDAHTAVLQARHVAGDEALTAQLLDAARALAQRRRDRLVTHLAQASDLRRIQPGHVAEMLEPDLKDGAGGLRDVQSLRWAGWTLGEPGDLDVLAARDYLNGADRARLESAEQRLLEVRVALHRITGRQNDLLALQEQDAVAAAVGSTDADALVRDLARCAREVAWIARDVFDRLRAGLRPPARRLVRRDRVIAEHVLVRDDRVVVTAEPPSALTVLEAAIAAAEQDLAFERPSLERIETMVDPIWDVWERAAFLRLLRVGDGAIPVFEALDHAGVLVRLLPEWAYVRSKPQRNAYHRFTVDRHLLEAVAECARLLDAGDANGSADNARRAGGIDATVARALRRPDLLLLGALLHDIGKGLEGDHSDAGARAVVTLTRRIGLDSEGREVLEWLVRDHLVMADTATRRDLSDDAVIERFADRCVGDPERLRLLYLLTVGDSKATGPAAWNRTKEALLRDLFVKAAAVVEQRGAGIVAEERRAALAAQIGAREAEALLERLPASYPSAFDAEEMARHADLLVRAEPAVSCRLGADGRPVVTVVAKDQRGLLATLAGTLTIAGLSVREAFLFSTDDGWALDVFRTDDSYGRFAEGGSERVEELLRAALSGSLDVDSGVRGRANAYRRSTAPGPVHVRFDVEASDVATVVEVDADDDVGVLYRVADSFARRGLDVSVAKVHTLGERIVDVFYVQDSAGTKIDDPAELDTLREILSARLGPGGWDNGHF